MRKLQLSRRRLLPALVGLFFVVFLGQSVFDASAAQLTSRSITMKSSKTSQTDVTYETRFTIATTGNVGGVVIDFCSNSPVVGLSCTAPTTFSTNVANLVLANQTGITDFAKDVANSTANKLVLTRTAASVSSGTAVRVDLGAGGASDGITNPSTTGTFYARIVTFATTAAAQAYASATPGTFVDDGGVALSTAAQLTVNARVAEILQFCVGTTAINDDVTAAPADCSSFSGTTINLGVVDNSTVNISPVATANGGNVMNGAAMVRTNAVNGVVIDYFAEQNTNSGKLKVSGATCVDNVSVTDQCFNSATTTQNALAAGTEEFGMTISHVNRTSSSTPTANLSRDTEYDGDGTASGGFAWDDTGTTDRIASSAAASSKVVDDEMLILRFAATAAITTPTGSYTVTSTYIATATY